MEDTFEKYLKLLWAIFFSFLGFLGVLALVLVILRFFTGLLDKIPGTAYVFTFFIIAMPAAFFISVFLIFWRRTGNHPSAGARITSYILFAVALGAWIFFFAKDMILFFTKFYAQVGQYMSYDIFLLGGSIFCIFLVGVIQALALPKKKHWLEERSRHNN